MLAAGVLSLLSTSQTEPPAGTREHEPSRLWHSGLPPSYLPLRALSHSLSLCLCLSLSLSGLSLSLSLSLSLRVTLPLGPALHLRERGMRGVGRVALLNTPGDPLSPSPSSRRRRRRRRGPESGWRGR